MRMIETRRKDELDGSGWTVSGMEACDAAGAGQ